MPAMIKPWKVLETNYLQPYLRVDRCELHNGQLLDCHLLEYNDEILVFAVTKDQEVVLIRQYRHGVEKVILELPGGSVDEGETPLEAAKRELMEETGYASNTWIEVGCISPNPAIYRNKIYSYLAFDAEPTGKQSSYDAEAVEVFLMPLDEVVEKARSGKFIHSLNIATLFFVLSYLQRIS
jgi:8-oxo-dGTP pyrophosphatase MutT (NUDIX family)